MKKGVRCKKGKSRAREWTTGRSRPVARRPSARKLEVCLWWWRFRISKKRASAASGAEAGAGATASDGPLAWFRAQSRRAERDPGRRCPKRSEKKKKKKKKKKQKVSIEEDEDEEEGIVGGDAGLVVVVLVMEDVLLRSECKSRTEFKSEQLRDALGEILERSQSTMRPAAVGK
ncbi:hypothetical protein KQX54_021429 [Cotesia glomerata]|uniref:Uncharacterized protein n=1 Tax=Cotesia glomerata TaxID=32391 RepID=A0AAV7J8L4_COTGL|nr:hypothetical protein KQX54_021429 [Cotesia glomerata]